MRAPTVCRLLVLAIAACSASDDGQAGGDTGTGASTSSTGHAPADESPVLDTLDHFGDDEFGDAAVAAG